MDYRILERVEIQGLRDIDRREKIEKSYYLDEGELKIKRDFYDVQGWNQEELESLIVRLYDLYDRGGTIYGAFIDFKIVGMVALDSKFIGKNNDRLKLDILYIDKRHRKKGIGKKLVDLTKSKAVELGATKLYISATPTQNTVDFYIGIGSELASEVNKELFELEPEDIHLELKL